MASKLTKPAVFKTVVNRSFAAQALAKPAANYAEKPRGQPAAKYATSPQTDPQVTSLPSGAVVASFDTNQPTAKVALVFKAGSRYETVANAGVSHVLRKSVGLATDSLTAFGIMRRCQQKGTSLYCEGGREHVLYGMDFRPDDVNFGLSVLNAVALEACFKPWEITTLKSQLHLDLLLRDNTTKAVENLHAAAFRSALGNSLYLPFHRMRNSSVTTEELKAFVDQTHVTAGMAVVGHGVDHNTLVTFAKSLSAPGAKGSSAGGYHGGEVRNENGSNIAHVAVCGAGASIGSGDSLALAVAQYALGTESPIKSGGNASSKLASIVTATGGAGIASAINANYSDGGLFGYLVVADDDAAGKIVKAVHAAVKNIKLTDAEVNGAKNQLKSALLMSTDSSDNTLEDLGLQALFTGKYVQPTALVALIDGVNSATVNSAISRAFSGKLSMGASGGLQTVPYLDEL